MCFIRIIILAVFLIVSVQGYCIYNKHPFATLRVTQIAGYGGDNFSNFKKYIKPSNSECCPYTDKSCCTSMTKDGVIKLEVEKFRSGSHMIPADFTAPCGGSAVISGSDTNLDIQVYDADGNPYPTTIEDGSRQVAAAGKVHGNHTANSTRYLNV